MKKLKETDQLSKQLENGNLNKIKKQKILNNSEESWCREDSVSISAEYEVKKQKSFKK